MATKTTQIKNWEPLFKYLDDNFATKEDIKKIVDSEAEIWLTKIDNMIALDKIADIVIKRMSSIMATKQDLKNLREELLAKFSHLPTKDQFYKKMDKWMKATTTHDLEKSAHKLDHSLLHSHLASPHTMQMV